MNDVDLFTLAGLVLGCGVALAVLVAWVFGGSVKALVRLAVAGTVVAFVMWAVIGLGGFVAVAVGVVFVAVWMTLFLVVHWIRHRGVSQQERSSRC